MSVLRNIASAWQLLVVIPLPVDTRAANPGAWLWLPGLAVGIAVAGIGWTVLWLPAPVAAALMLFCELILTGGLHLDGWSDCWDGWGCRCNPEKRLAAIKDSRIGSIGAAALAALMLLKFSLYADLAGTTAIIPAHIASRAALTVCARLIPGRNAGLGAEFSRQINHGAVCINLLAAVAALWLFTDLWMIAALSSGLLAAIGYAWYFARLAGGLSGDVLGGAEETALITVMTLFVLRQL